jgi:hypothetical protein
MSVSDELRRRIKVGRYFKDLVDRKIAGRIGWEEFLHRTSRIVVAEQLPLGLDASSEMPDSGRVHE